RKQLIVRGKLVRVDVKMDERFEEREGGMFGQIDRWAPALVPTGRDTAPTFSRQVRVVRDAPESYTSGKKAPLHGIEQVLDEPRPGLGREIGEGRRLAERALRFAQPSVRLCRVAENPLRQFRHAGEADRPVGFLDRQRLSLLDSPGKGPPRHHQGK